MESDGLNKEVILEALIQALPYVGGSLATKSIVMCRILRQDMIEWKDVHENIICGFYLMPGKNKSAYYMM